MHLRPTVVEPPEAHSPNSHCTTMDQYRAEYEKSVNDPEAFWTEIGKGFFWKTTNSENGLKANICSNFDPTKGDVRTSFYAGATTNICYNVLDRIVEQGKGDKVCFFWEGNDIGDHDEITYADLLKYVKKFAAVLKRQGVKKGDRVCLYMPMVIELPVAMLACARIGAIHSIVFAGFSAESLHGRILDSKSEIVITADGFYRGNKLVELKIISDEACKLCERDGFKVTRIIVLRHLTPASDEGHSHPPPKRPCSELKVSWVDSRDSWWHDLMTEAGGEEAECEWMDAEDPLFMLYTSGSTGKPKGVLHTVGGYMVYAATTFKYSFDYQPDDVYFCTADIGWITGHSYITYGPMANGASSILFEGTPLYPDAGRLWAIVEKFKVTQVYTAPTAIRLLMKYGEDCVRKHDRSSLRVLGTVGEPINPDSWWWYYKVVGDSKCPVVDTYWQTETGGHVIANIPYATPMRPGSASFPFFGIQPAILDESGAVIEKEGEGFLVIKNPWPAIARTVYGDHKRYERTYFGRFPGYYLTGDRARRDEHGYIWIAGRIDDMINVSGHLLSTAEVESSLVEHPSLVEAAVIGKPHATKGECVYCFITLRQGCEFNDILCKELVQLVRHKIGAFAAPDYIHHAPSLPKTRSGKIMRRVLRKIAAHEEDQIGDTSTLADESVVELLVSLRPTQKKE